jgi:putative phage-type endonuclease
MSAPTIAVQPMCGWSATDAEWLRARRSGISASDVAAVLGFSQYKTPWEVWADKTGRRPRETDAAREAIRLGVALEPWLLAQARHQLGADVRRTAHRLYAHPEHGWRLCSPDGEVADRDWTLVEAKTAGLASGFGVPDGWTEQRAPLGYELQCRWQMHVMGRPQAVLIGLVAGVGMRRYEYTRDVSVEADMVAQVTEWWQRHILGRVEPPMGARDNALMDATHPTAGEGSIALDDDPDLPDLILQYRDGLAREKEGKALKEAATAQLKRKLGDHPVGTVRNQPVVTWNAKTGAVDWLALVEDLVEIAGWSGPLLDLDALVDRYRKPDSRQIHVKGVAA